MLNRLLVRYFLCAPIFLILGIFLFGNIQSVHAESLTPEQRIALQQQLNELEKEIDAQRGILEVKRNQRVSLERDIAILTAQIKEAKLSIRARNLRIQSLIDDIQGKEATINVLSSKIDREKSEMAELLRKIDEIELTSPIEVFLTNKSLSKFFEDIDHYSAVQDALRQSYTQIGVDRHSTQIQRDVLQDKKDEQSQLLSIQKLQQARLLQQEEEKTKILALTKGVEADYQKVLQSKVLSANSIRAQLFQLQGSAAIPFGTALQYANVVSQKTGVRAALILGIITEESNLGKNVGKGNWLTDMKAPRDTVPFQQICQELGLDPNKMPVSAKQWYGYGGAMGPAQFIPSTWMLYKDKIAKATGNNPPNPWDPQDAFMAAGILLKENGADKGTRAAERLAALRYLAGWANAQKKAYAFYGDDVMSFADKYQQQINILASN